MCVCGGGVSGPPTPWNCQIINFCHVENFRQTRSGNLDTPPPPLRKFSGSVHVIVVLYYSFKQRRSVLTYTVEDGLMLGSVGEMLKPCSNYPGLSTVN